MGRCVLFLIRLVCVDVNVVRYECVMLSVVVCFCVVNIICSMICCDSICCCLDRLISLLMVLMDILVVGIGVVEVFMLCFVCGVEVDVVVKVKKSVLK